MRIESTHTYKVTQNNNNKSTQNANNVSFEGLNLSKLFQRSSKKETAYLEYLDNIITRYGGYLGLDTKTGQETLNGVSPERISFFKRIADRYNGQNFHAEQKEDTNIALGIFNSIQKPQEHHFYIIDHIRGSFEDLERVFKYADDEKNMEFIHNFHKKYRGYKYRDKYIIDVLDSPLRETYLKDIEKYKSYLIVNSDNPNAIKELDKLVSSGNFSEQEFDIQYTLKIINRFEKNMSNVLTPELLKENYSKEGLHILRKLTLDFTFHNPRESHLKEFLKIYNSTNKNNLEFREKFLEAYQYSADDNLSKSMKDSEITALRELFEKADKDKHVRNFLERVTTQGIGTKSIEEINDILKVVPPKKAEIFFDNISRITSMFEGPRRYDALINHLEEPFYTDKIIAKRNEEYGYYSFHSDGIFSKVKRYINNKFNILKYGVNVSVEAKSALPEVPPTMKKRIKPISREKSLVPIPQSQTVLERILANLTKQIQETERLEELRKIELKRSLKEARKAKKLKLISDVNDIISKKLGKRTLEDQSVNYTKKATKIRLSLLPDIFESIKATRKAERALGNKESVSSKDALELYKRINGHNRKIVRYMLLKEHEGSKTRVYTVKDIINFLDNSEKIIAKNKALDKNYKPKTYYDLAFEICTNTFGKLPAKKNVKQ